MAKGNQNAKTPLTLFFSIQELFNIKFKYDLAASVENALCPDFITEEQDSLSIDWPTGVWCWLNPPFWNLTRWIRKCDEQAARGVKIVSIWPLSSDLNTTPAWKNSCVYALHGRVWPLVRSCMVCEWGGIHNGQVCHLRWTRKTGELKVM